MLRNIHLFHDVLNTQVETGFLPMHKVNKASRTISLIDEWFLQRWELLMHTEVQVTLSIRGEGRALAGEGRGGVLLPRGFPVLLLHGGLALVNHKLFELKNVFNLSRVEYKCAPILRT